MFALFAVIFVGLMAVLIGREVSRGSRVNRCSDMPKRGHEESILVADEGLDELHQDFLEDKWFDRGIEVNHSNNIGFSDD